MFKLRVVLPKINLVRTVWYSEQFHQIYIRNDDRGRMLRNVELPKAVLSGSAVPGAQSVHSAPITGTGGFGTHYDL